MKRIILPVVAAFLGVLAVAAFLYFRGKRAPGDSQDKNPKVVKEKPGKNSGGPTATRPPAATGTPVTLRTETYTVTYTPMRQVAGSLEKLDDGFHLSTGSGEQTSFYLVASRPGESLSQVARGDKGFAKKDFLRGARKVVSRESAGKFHLVHYYWGDDNKTEWVSVYSRHDDLVFRIDWFGKPDPKDPDDLRGKNVLKLYDHLTIRQVRK